MKTLSLVAGLALVTIASPASADHMDNLDTPYASLGECEAASQAFTMDDRAGLLAMFPDFFENRGDVTSYLIRSFPCEYSEADEQWYIQNHRTQVFLSDWFQRRH